MAVEGGPIAQAAAEIVADTSTLTPDLVRKMRTAGKAAGQGFDAELNRQLRDTGSKISRDINGRMRDERGRFVATGRDTGFSWGNAFKAGIALTLGRAALKAIFAPLAAVAGALGLSVLGAGAAASAAGVISLVAALGPATGILLAFPAAGLAAAAVVGTLKVAFAGMGDAFSAALEGDPRAFTEALEKLGPAARQVATEFRDLAPELHEVRKATQDAFFGPLVGQLGAIAATLLGPVRAGMASVAATAGLTALGLAQVAAQSQTALVLAGAFDVANGSIAAMTPGLLAVVVGVRDLAGAVLPMMTQVGDAAGGAAMQFGEWLSYLAESGRAVEWVRGALQTFRELGTVVQQVGGILATVFGAANTASGGGALAALGENLRSINATLSSGPGNAALVSIFTALSAVAQALAPVLSTLLVAFGGIAPIAADIAIALGPGLAAAIQAIGTALVALGPGLTAIAAGLATGLAAAGPGLEALGASLGVILAALAPTMPVLGEFVGLIGTVLAQALTTLAPALGPLVAVLLRLLTAFAPLVPLVGEVAAVVGQALTEALVALLPALGPLIDGLVAGLLPALPELARAFTALITAIAPSLPAIGQLAGLLLRLMGFGLEKQLMIMAEAFELIGAVITPLTTRIAALVGWLTALDFGAIGASIRGAFTDARNAILSFFAGLPSQVGDALSSLGSTIITSLTSAGSDVGSFFADLPAQIGSALSSLGSAIGDAFVTAGSEVASFAAELPGMIVDGLAGLGSLFADMFTTALQAGLFAIGAGIGLLLQAIIVLPDLIWDALTSLPGLIADAFTTAWQSAKDATSTAAYEITLFALNLVTDIGTFLTNLPTVIADAFTGAWQSAKDATSTAAYEITLFALNLVTDIGTFLTNLPTVIGNAFTTAWQWGVDQTVAGVNNVVTFVSGIAGTIGSLLSSLPGVVGGVFRNAFSGAKTATTDGINGVMSTIRGLPGQITAFGGQMFDAGKTIAGRLVDGLKQLGSFVSGLGRSLLNYVIDGINRGISSVWALPGGAPQIPRMAFGDIVDRKTIAMIGEGGREVVIPLTKPARAQQLAADSGLLDMLIRRGAVGGDGASQPRTVVHAPITLAPPYADPALVAEATVDELMRKAGV